MKMASARGIIEMNESKFKYMVVYDGWHYFKNEWHTMVYKRTNDLKVAQKALKNMEAKCGRELEGHISAKDARLIVNE